MITPGTRKGHSLLHEGVLTLVYGAALVLIYLTGAYAVIA